MDIQSITGAMGKAPSLPDKSSNKPGNFAALVSQYVQETNQENKASGKASLDLALGKSENVSETLLAMQKSKVSFQLMLSARNKLVNAYREVMRMQV